MASRKRRYFSPEQKVLILKRHLVDHVPVSELCDELGLHPNNFYQWQKLFFERGAAAFTSERTEPAERQRAREVAALKAKLTKKDAVIAEISEEYIALKKELGEL
jgi:transposase